MPNCLLCNAELSAANRAREHVFPQWLLDYFQMDADELFRGKHLAFSGGEIGTRVQGARTIIQGRVCEGCNSGWMSDLESAVKPLVLTMIEGRPISILKPGLEKVAAWAFKVLGLYNVTTNFHRLVTERTFHVFGLSHVPPPGYHIELAYLPDEPTDRLRTIMSSVQLGLGHPKEVEVLAKLLHESCSLVMQLGKLILRVVGLPRTDIWIRADELTLSIARIYPGIPSRLTWPLPPLGEPILSFQASPALVRYSFQ